MCNNFGLKRFILKKAKIGVIGGSGLYEIEGVKVIDNLSIDTPWGSPSDNVTIVDVNGIHVAFLPRHGKGHRMLPHEVNYTANIAALKMLGVEDIIAFSACGSLKEEIKPLDFIIPDQIIDRTKSRTSTFFGNGIAGHISFAHPFCQRLKKLIIPVAENLGINLHIDETLICMEGPAFSTRAESNLYRSWGAGIINMTAVPEAQLAREAEICYSVVCMSTDYDCWRVDEEHVSVELIIGNLMKNSANAKRLLKSLLIEIGKERDCECPTASKYAIITAENMRSIEQKEKLRKIFPEYF